MEQVEGLPEAAEPVISLQLSSPIEEATLTKVFDPAASDTSGMVAIFRGVEIKNATLSVAAARPQPKGRPNTRCQRGLVEFCRKVFFFSTSTESGSSLELSCSLLSSLLSS